MKILLKHTESGNHHLNEDRIGYIDNIVWVMDGLTEIFSNHIISRENDVVWFVEEMNYELKHTDTALPLRDFLAIAITKVYRKALLINPSIVTYEPFQLPSATIAMLKMNNNRLEYLILGDCVIITEEGDILTDCRLNKFHQKIVDEKKKYTGLSCYDVKIKEAVQNIRKTINTKDGYWVLGMDNRVVDYAITGSIYVHSQANKKYLCCSDGFYPSIIENCNIDFSICDLFEKNNLLTLIQKQIEEERKREVIENRIVRDDLSVILVQFE